MPEWPAAGRRDLRNETRMKQVILFSIGAAAGILMAYVDSLPHWDDSGILAGGLLVISALLTLLGANPPWLVALAVGAWLPLRGIYATHDGRMLIVLLFPLVGAYLGSLVRWGTSKVRPLT
jgi:hypothetical protein